MRVTVASFKVSGFVAENLLGLGGSGVLRSRVSR